MSGMARLAGLGFICLTLAARGQEVVAVYGEAARAQKEPPAGWSFLWNAGGPVGDARHYEPVPYDPVSKLFCFTNATGKVDGRRPRINLTGLPATQDPEQVARYWIAGYTLPEDAPGEIWLRQGNIAHRLGGDTNGLALKVFVNDRAIIERHVPRQRRPTLFQENLGRLGRGDTVYVMVGPGVGAAGLFNLHFTLERWPVGAVPPPPVTIISPEMTAVTPHRDARGELQAGYVRQHEAFMDAARKQPPSLVFLGDSITAGWPRDLLDKHFGQYAPANHGISGDWIQGLRWRVANGIYDEVKPRLIVLLIGVNNLSNGFTPDEVARGTRLLVEDLRVKTPETRILLLGIFPRGRSFVPPAGDDIRAVNAMTARLADGEHVFFLDLGAVLTEPDGSIAAEVFPDGLHPGRPGYERWAAAILPHVARLAAKD